MDGEALLGGGLQIDDKNKTRVDLIGTSLQSDSMHVYKLLSDFKSLCKILATIQSYWNNTMPFFYIR
jgi:hypothetical protein